MEVGTPTTATKSRATLKRPRHDPVAQPRMTSSPMTAAQVSMVQAGARWSSQPNAPTICCSRPGYRSRLPVIVSAMDSGTRDRFGLSVRPFARRIHAEAASVATAIAKAHSRTSRRRSAARQESEPDAKATMTTMIASHNGARPRLKTMKLAAIPSRSVIGCRSSGAEPGRSADSPTPSLPPRSQAHSDSRWH